MNNKTKTACCYKCNTSITYNTYYRNYKSSYDQAFNTNCLNIPV